MQQTHDDNDDEASDASSDYREWLPRDKRKHRSRLSDIVNKTTGIEGTAELTMFAKQMWIENLPLSLVKELPGWLMWSIGAIAYLLVILIFIYAVYQGAANASKTFITLDEGSGNCETVSKSLSGIFFMDTEGHWSGSNDFLYERAIYEINFNRLVLHDEKSFENFMDIFFRTLEGWGVISLRAPLADQILMWMTWQMELDVAGTSQIFRLTGHPRKVFHAESFFG